MDEATELANAVTARTRGSGCGRCRPAAAARAARDPAGGQRPRRRLVSRRSPPSSGEPAGGPQEARGPPGSCCGGLNVRALHRPGLVVVATPRRRPAGWDTGTPAPSTLLLALLQGDGIAARVLGSLGVNGWSSARILAEVGRGPSASGTPRRWGPSASTWRRSGAGSRRRSAPRALYWRPGRGCRRARAATSGSGHIPFS